MMLVPASIRISEEQLECLLEIMKNEKYDSVSDVVRLAVVDYIKKMLGRDIKAYVRI